MVVAGVLEAELLEDGGDVLLDGADADDEALGDGGVGAALRHQLEDLALARGQRRQRVGAAHQQLAHDLRVEHRAAGRDSGDGVAQLVEGGDAVLEEVAGAALAAREELLCIGALDVLAEEEDADPRVLAAQLQGRPDALVAEGGRHADVEDGDVRREVAHGRQQRGGVAERAGGDEAGLVEQADEALA